MSDPNERAREALKNILVLLFPSSFPAEDEDVDEVLSAFAAAGIGLYDTKTRVAVPREPTPKTLRSMAEAAWYVLGNDIPAAEVAEMSKVYRAMLAAAEETPAEKVSG